MDNLYYYEFLIALACLFVNMLVKSVALYIACAFITADMLFRSAVSVADEGVLFMLGVSAIFVFSTIMSIKGLFEGIYKK